MLADSKPYFIFIGLTAVGSCMVIYLRRIWLYAKERKVLRAKYGDIKMFEHFFKSHYDL